MSIDKEIYNKLDEQYNHLQNEHKIILEQRLQQNISAQTLNSFQSLNDNMKNNSDFIKSIHESIINLNEKIQKPTVKPILPLPNSQPLFSGKTNENIILWFTVTENNFRLSNIPPDSYVAYTLSYLRDLALQTHRSIATITPNITWDQFKTKFTAKFSDPNANHALLQKLKKFKQTGDSDSYVEQFLFLMN